VHRDHAAASGALTISTAKPAPVPAAHEHADDHLLREIDRGPLVIRGCAAATAASTPPRADGHRLPRRPHCSIAFTNRHGRSGIVRMVEPAGGGAAGVCSIASR